MRRRCRRAWERRSRRGRLGETKANITLREVEDFLKVVGRVRPAMQCDDVRAIFFAYRASGDARQAVAATGGYLAFPHDIIVQPG